MIQSAIIKNNPPPKVKNSIGKVIGNLTILSYVGKCGNKYYVNVRCKCGQEKIVDISNLIWGTTVSCGCYNYGDKLKSRKHG